MLTCIACSKQPVLEEEEDDDHGATPATKGTVKSLTSQIKDMALKVSGAYRQSKASSSTSGNYKKGNQRQFTDNDTVSEGGASYPDYLRGGGGSSSSTPAWDFPPVNRDHASDTRFKGMSGDGRARLDQSGNLVLVDDEEPKEWMAQVEPGVHITFLSLPLGGNDLKRIRFSREMFNKWQAQRWWGENYDRIVELYNVQRFSRQALHTPPRSEDERDSSYSRMGSEKESPMAPSLGKEWRPKNSYRPSGLGGGGGSRGFFPSSDPMEQGGGGGGSQHYGGAGSNFQGGVGFKGDASSIDASRTTTSSRDEASISISNASDMESEWVEQDEPGVYITIRQLPDGTRELRRVRFSREKFGEGNAKLWWEENRERIQAQYL